MPELAAVQAVVHGHVQGVYFRVFTRDEAIRLGLTGSVRNRYPFGTVEVTAEGAKARLEELINKLREGPAGARVNRVDVRWSDYQGIYAGFSIDYRPDED